MELVETLAVVIGVVLILALATQSLQELLKVVWPVKAQVRLSLARGLLEESTLAAGLHIDDARALSREVVDRLRSLGLRGVRKGAVRVDDLTADQLVALVERVNPALIPSLHALGTRDGSERQKAKTKEIAEHVRAWYPVAMSGMAARTTRRMRGFSLITSFAVVVALNVDALTLWSRVDADPKLRKELLEVVTDVRKQIDALEEAEEQGGSGEDDDGGGGEDDGDDGGDDGDGDDGDHGVNGDGLDDGDDGDDAPDEPVDERTLAERQAELERTIQEAVGSGLLAPPGDRRWNDPDWWLGIAIMTLLVSLGMPFWHETLGTLLGLRQRITPPGQRPASPPSGPVGDG